MIVPRSTTRHEWVQPYAAQASRARARLIVILDDVHERPMSPAQVQMAVQWYQDRFRGRLETL